MKGKKKRQGFFMDVSLGNAGITPLTMASSSVPSVTQNATPAITPPRSMLLAAQLAQNMLMPTSISQVQFISIRRAVIPLPPRATGPDRDERKRGEFLRRVKISKSEAMSQHTQNRS